MKKILLNFIIVTVINCSVNLSAQTAGTLTCVFTATTPTGSTFYSGTKNTLAAWIETSTGTFVKTKIDDYGGGTSDHLPTWNSKSGGNTTDATSGATRSNFATVTFTWNGTNVAGAIVADGTYNIVIEDCWNHGTTGIKTSTLSFTKSTTPSTVSPTATNYIKGVTITWQPAVAPIPVANFVTSTTKCVGSVISFTDQSTNTPTSWSWTFPGASPASSTAQNPTATYTAAGTYTVTHSSTNASGTSTLVSQSIIVSASPTVSASNATTCAGTPINIIASGATTYSWSTGATTSSITVTPTSSTNYTITGKNTSGCANTKTLSVTVNVVPIVVVTNTAICNGGMANLIASGATAYNWNTGAATSSISVMPTSNTVYTVTGTTSGCSNTKTVSVTVNTTPNVIITNTTICSGSSVNLIASGASSYTWSTGAVASSIFVSPTNSTNYTVTGSNGNCLNTKTVSVTVNTSPIVAVTNTAICNGGMASLLASGASSYNWNTGATTSSISVMPTSNTVYTVTGTSSGCTNTKTVSVTVNALPLTSVNSTTICAGSTATLTASGASTYSWNTGATVANLTASPTTNTTYTVTGISAAGCVKTATANIVVGSAPAITVNSTSICTGSSATLTASGVTTYTWNTGANTSGITVNPTSTTVYTVSGNLVGCASSAVKTTTVTVNALPTVTLSIITGPLCINSSTQALSSSPAGGVYSGTGVSGSVFNPTASGAGTFTYAYSYTNTAGCSATTSHTVSVGLCTGIAESNIVSIISIYPNPVNELLYVTIESSLINNSTIELYDMIGNLVLTEKPSIETTELSLAHLSKGMYTIRILSSNGQRFIKLIKE